MLEALGSNGTLLFVSMLHFGYLAQKQSLDLTIVILSALVWPVLLAWTVRHEESFELSVFGALFFGMLVTAMVNTGNFRISTFMAGSIFYGWGTAGFLLLMANRIREEERGSQKK